MHYTADIEIIIFVAVLITDAETLRNRVQKNIVGTIVGRTAPNNIVNLLNIKRDFMSNEANVHE